MLAAMTTDGAAGDPGETVVRPWVRPGPVRTACLVMGSAGAAAIHFAVIPAHAAESTVLAVGFAVVAWLQAGFAVGALVRPSRGLLLGGAVLNLAALSVWGWSRLFGLPFGLGGGEIEPVAAVDAMCGALELAVVVAAIWPARAGATRRAAPAVVAVAGVAGLLVIGATSAVLAAASTHEHAHDAAHDEALGEAHEHGHEHQHAAAAGPTVQHAGAGAHEHAACTSPVTRAQQSAADELVAATRATLAHYTSFDTAVADGFVHVTPEGGRVVHYARPDWASDGRVLDPSAPEVLVYAFPPRVSPVLLGAMYLMEGPAEPPTPGGCLTQWHDHTNLCVAPGQGMVAFTGPDGSCPPGSSNRTTRAMMHVWRYDTSAGPFAELSELPVDELRAAILAGRPA
jgi:hypothetical protein